MIMEGKMFKKIRVTKETEEQLQAVVQTRTDTRKSWKIRKSALYRP